MIVVGDHDEHRPCAPPGHLDRHRAIASARVVALVDTRRQRRLARGIEGSDQA
jgi:hypothetical protein